MTDQEYKREANIELSDIDIANFQSKNSDKELVVDVAMGHAKNNQAEEVQEQPQNDQLNCDEDVLETVRNFATERGMLETEPNSKIIKPGDNILVESVNPTAS